MKHFFTLIYMCLVLPFYACSQVNESGGALAVANNDPEKVEAAAEIRVAPYNDNDFMMPVEVNKASDIPLQHVTSADIKQMVGKADYTWVIVWASWCPHCREGLGQFPKDAEKMRTMKDINLVYVAEDYNLETIQKRLFSAGYKQQAYVLNPTVYTFDEDFKLRRIRHELCAQCPDEDGAVPQHFIYNRKGELIMHQMGGDMDDIAIMSAIERFNNKD